MLDLDDHLPRHIPSDISLTKYETPHIHRLAYDLTL